MDLFIRSQDKTFLTNIRNVFIDEKNEICTIDTMRIVKLGIYNSKERALEVLDEIQKRIVNLQLVNLEEKEKARKDVNTREYFRCVYEMQKE